MNLLFCSFMLFGLGAQVQDRSVAKIQYYRTFAGYNLPLKLIQPLPREEAEAAKEAFYVGYFDECQRLVKVEKFLKGKLLFTHKYEYHPNGVMKRLVNTPSEGPAVVKDYDEKGNRLSLK